MGKVLARNAPYTRLQKTLVRYQGELVGELQAEMAKWTDDKNVRNVCSILNNEQKVKTIWRTDESIRIDKFYYPSKVKQLLNIEAPDEDPVEVEMHDDFGVNAAILIEGIVAHGKSILLPFIPLFSMFSGNTFQQIA